MAEPALLLLFARRGVRGAGGQRARGRGCVHTSGLRPPVHQSFTAERGCSGIPKSSSVHSPAPMESDSLGLQRTACVRKIDGPHEQRVAWPHLLEQASEFFQISMVTLPWSSSEAVAAVIVDASTARPSCTSRACRFAPDGLALCILLYIGHRQKTRATLVKLAAALPGPLTALRPLTVPQAGGK